MGKATKTKPRLSPQEKHRRDVIAKAEEIGVPAAAYRPDDYELADVSLDPTKKVTTHRTLINRGGTPIARWKAAKLLSDSQLAAIDHCERLWSILNGKSLVMDYGRVISGGTGNGWAEQEAIDDLHRIKGYFPMKWWSVFESVCRFDEPAGFAGSRLTECANDQVSAARTTVQFVADVIAMKERLSA